MENNIENIHKELKEHGFNSIEELKKKPISIINNFMKETELSYFEVFLETEISDIREFIQNDDIRIIRVKNGTKRPQDTDFFNKKLKLKEILNHTGNFGVCVGYNHIKGKSLAVIDIDGFKIPKLTKAQKQLLPLDQVELLENLTDDRKEEILKESKDYLLRCLLSGLPSAMAVQTQSGGYHIYIWNQTHLNNELEDVFHYVSKRLSFPANCPIEEIRGLSMLNSLEIFTTFESKQCVLAGSFTKNFKTGETNFYKLLEVAENTRTLGDLGTVANVNETVKNHLINLGFEWTETPQQQQEEETTHKPKSKKSKEQVLNPLGILKDLSEEETTEVVEILLPFFDKKRLQGVGHYTVFALGGYFSNTITQESAIAIINELLTKANYESQDIAAGEKAIRENYTRKGFRKTGLNTAFNNIQDRLALTEEEREMLKKQIHNICYPTMSKTNKSEQDLEILIKQSLCKNSKPSIKLLADYINKQGSFFIDYETGNRYKLEYKEINGESVPIGFEEVELQDISIFLNMRFGKNEISLRECRQIIDYITNPIKTNYDLIIFNNGTLNTRSGEWLPNEYLIQDDEGKYYLPKIRTNLNYIEEAEEQFKAKPLYDDFQKILQTTNRKGWDWNESLYYKCVGVSAMAINESDCFFIIVGKPNARKTTLLTPLKRFFNYSEVKIQTIAKNERFQVLPCIRKDINIDDDLSDTLINNSGFFKTFISGAGGSVERKGENIFAQLTAETTPIIWGASNKLPTIHGEGIERRTCLLLAENPIDPAEADKTYQRNILDGLRDDEIELMISYSLQEYFKTREEPFLTEEQQKEMLKEWDWKSYPAKMGASLVFMDTEQFIDKLEAAENVQNVKYNERENTITYETRARDNLVWVEVEKETFTPVWKVNKEFKKFHKLSLESGKIFRELSKPSTKLINEAMKRAGFFQARKFIKDDYGNREQIRIYEDCIINPKWEIELKELR